MRDKPGFHLPLTSDLETALNNLAGFLEVLYEDPNVPEGDLQTVMPEYIHDIFMALWMHNWVETEQTPFPDPTVCFVALSSMSKDGHWEPKSITNPLATVTFNMRVAFKQEALNRVPDNSQDGIHTAMVELSQWYVEHKHTPFSSIRSLQHLATSLAYSTPSMPKCWWTDKSYQALRIAGKKIAIDDMKEMCQNLEKQMVNAWDDDVLMGLDINAPHTDLADDLGSKEVGYSMISDPRNPLGEYKDSLLTGIMTTPHLFKKFVHVDYNNKHSWNINACHAWLRKLAALELLCMVCTEILTGGPGRGTELEAMTFCNTPTRQRNLFAMGDMICYVRMYLKTLALSGVDRLLPAAFPTVLANLMVNILAVARPLAQLFARVCFPNDTKVEYQYATQLYMGYATTIGTEKQTQCLQKLSNEYLHCEIGTREWRQVSTTIRRMHTKAEWDFMEGEQNAISLEALQMGHSRRTDLAHYGVTTSSLLGSEDMLPGFLQVSCVWQGFHRVVPGRFQVVREDNNSRSRTQVTSP
jgi:hypothetical protein